MDNSQSQSEKRLLQEANSIAVVGLSPNKARPSYTVGKYLLNQGYQIFPINPKYSNILGIRSYASLKSLPQDIVVDIVNIFRHPTDVYPIVQEAVEIGAKSIWMQEGIFHQDSKELAKHHGLDVISDRCIMKSHKSWF